MKLTANTNRLLSEHPHQKQTLSKLSVHYWAQTDHIRQVAFFSMEDPHSNGFSVKKISFIVVLGRFSVDSLVDYLCSHINLKREASLVMNNSLERQIGC